MNEKPPFKFLATTPPSEEADDILYANGIFADTGLPLCQMNIEELAEIAADQTSSKIERQVSQAKYDDATVAHYGTIGEVAPNNLSESGWGIVFPEQAEDDRKKALEPLIEHRRRQVLERCDPDHGDVLFRVFDGADGYKPGESCTAWLARQGVGTHVVDPLDGVPFYLLLVGSPEEIPFEFQYLLDIYWGVGRLHFDDSGDYRRYAESVVAYETAGSVPHSKTAAIFATRHNADRATQMFSDLVARPLALGQEAHDRKAARPPVGKRQGYDVRDFIGKDKATKETLTQILQGKIEGGPPALLLTGSHGMGFRVDDPRLDAEQGALLCQDWTGFGSVRSDHWFAAGELPSDARIHGLIHFFFGCYGAGCPQFDDFVMKPGEKPQQIAPRPLVARLPQKMLAHPNGGALAALGHVDRAWASSFSSPRTGPQLQGFRDVIGRILSGDRLGQATDQFDVRRAALSAELIERQRDVEDGKQVPDREIADLWIARNDARNYVILGDPAARLRVEDV